MTKYDLAVLGSINLDIMVTVGQYPAYGDTVLAKRIEMLPGGKGANQAVTAAKLGKRTAFIGVVGDDSAGRQMVENLVSYGIEDRFIQKTVAYGTGTFVPIVDSQGENTMVGTLGANQALNSDFVITCLDEIEADVLLLQMETSAESILAAMKKAKEKGMTVILDPAPAERFDVEALQYADIITPNVQETYSITGICVTDIDTAIEVAKKLESMGVKKSIIKMGSEGNVLYQDGQVVVIPALSVKAQNTVGAGDTFVAALACAYSSSPDLEKAVQYGNIAAELKVSRAGGQNGIPTHEEIEAYY